MSQSRKPTVVMTTVPEQAIAERLAKLLVERKLAACVQILGPMSSTYVWQGKLETSFEFLLLVKTAADRIVDVTHAIRDNHPYDVPEVLGLPVVTGSMTYLNWLFESVPPVGLDRPSGPEIGR